jgi:two-component system, NtrC family, sensor kinase
LKCAGQAEPSPGRGRNIIPFNSIQGHSAQRSAPDQFRPASFGLPEHALLNLEKDHLECIFREFAAAAAKKMERASSWMGRGRVPAIHNSGYRPSAPALAVRHPVRIVVTSDLRFFFRENCRIPPRLSPPFHPAPDNIGYKYLIYGLAVPKGLAQKLVLSLTVIVVLITGGAGLLSLRSQEQHLLNVMILGADQLSRSLTSATWHAMLANNKQAAYEVMETVALKQGIEQIRMFNREGRVTFSTLEGEENLILKKTAVPCVRCHAQDSPVDMVDLASRVHIEEPVSGHRRLDVITPIYNEPSCSQASCHAHPAKYHVLGVLELSLHLEEVDSELANARYWILITAGVQILLIGLFIVLFTRRFVAKPVRHLIDATKAVSVMNLDTPIPVEDSSTELGELSGSFRAMQQRLRDAVSELNQFTQQLEAKVKERTVQLESAHRKLLHADRLASLGELAASVAHEINNPVSSVLNLSMLMQRIMGAGGVPPERLPQFRKYLNQVSSETTRVGRIVTDLLSFSRRGKPQRTEVDLNRILEATVSLVSHKLKLMNVEVVVETAPDLPMVLCDGSQIQQVVLNLLLNSAEATQGRPSARVTLQTAFDPTASQVILSVADSGEGIPEENLKRIFDPFFTTKPEGKGVGLGLAVAYGIVEAHEGEIEVRSRMGEGTVFRVKLPLSSKEVPAAEAVLPGARV